MHDASPSVSVPRITTERLLLRELRTSDFDAYATHMADPVATQFIRPAPDRRTAWRFFRGLAGEWMLTGAGWWMVELRETRESVGTVGAFFREDALADPANADLELGWSFFRPFWRRGFATEAARAALAFGFAQYPVRRAIAHVELANVASVRVSEALGMQHDAEVEFENIRLTRFAVDRPI